ncbi:MAG: iron chelate uptake ABC transporter family permease subunit, partial [Candidatus Hydrogenedentes bacterium]|nr:iron chelate uptake ABC transporter family permease subunit [Candidatus Hydrogenedentota bacterium]
MTGGSRRTALTVCLVAACLAVAVSSLFTGTESVSVARAWAEWRQGRSPAESPVLSILLHQRLPRTLAALVAGGGLALAGCAFQALLRNPLATPYTLGIASAGAFGAWTATILLQWQGLALSLLGFSPVQGIAFLFAAFDVGLIYFMATRKARLSPSVLLLAGVTMGMLANAGILFMRYLALPEEL